MLNLTDFTILQFEIGVIINKDKNLLLATNNIDIAKKEYNELLDKYKNDTKNHIIIFVFDYDKNINIEYYDNRNEIL